MNYENKIEMARDNKQSDEVLVKALTDSDPRGKIVKKLFQINKGQLWDWETSPIWNFHIMESSNSKSKRNVSHTIYETF